MGGGGGSGWSSSYSGGGGSGGTGDEGAGPSGKSDECDLAFDIDLSGVQAAVLATVKVNDKLAVRTEVRGTYTSVVCATNGAVLGSLSAFLEIALLIECLSRGNTYEATITKIGKGSCTVHVQRV